jgi:uncharacterized membrane protein YfcA
MLESVWIIPLLFITGGIAGLIDAISGGGGLLTLPMLLSVGCPPHIALGTNKFQSSFGSFTSTFYYRQHDIVKIREAIVGIFFTAVGTVVGTWFVQEIDSSFLGHLIPWLLLGIAVYMILTPRIGDSDRKPKIRQNIFYMIFGTLLGFYDGFFGPGVGSFWAIMLVIMLGFNLTKATGYTKLMNFTSNIISAVVFIIGGNVWFTIGLIMAGGQVIGSTIGARLVIRKGTRLIRPVYIIIVILTTLNLLYRMYF